MKHKLFAFVGLLVICTMLVPAGGLAAQPRPSAAADAVQDAWNREGIA